MRPRSEPSSSSTAQPRPLAGSHSSFPSPGELHTRPPVPLHLAAVHLPLDGDEAETAGAVLGELDERGRHEVQGLGADVLDAAVIAADPAHWNVAASALVRAVAFDGLEPGHPAMSMLLGALAPIAEAELAYHQAITARPRRAGLEREDGAPEFPELDGPVFLLGACALVDATWAVVGEDPLGEVLGVLLPVLDGTVPGVEGRVVADALIGAFAEHYRCEQPGDADVLERIARPADGDPLENFVAAGAVPPAGVLTSCS